MVDPLTIEGRDGDLVGIHGPGLEAIASMPSQTTRRWAAAYASELVSQSAGSRALGATLFEAIAEHADWFERAALDTHRLEFVVRRRSPEVLSLLDVPWELLRGPSGWFVDRQISIVRRMLSGSRPAARAREPSRHRLLVLFMAGPMAPELDSLDYAREEAAILQATARGRREHGLDLLVESTGVIDDLARRLALEDGVAGEVAPDVLHLSCHGDLGHGRPTVLLETPRGQVDAVDAERFVAALSGRTPRLVFLNAAYTASSVAGAPSFAQSLVDAGVPAALGWAGEVTDDGAIIAASELYAALANAESLEVAVARARARLLREELPDWHHLRLFLGAHGGGAMVRAADQSSRLRAFIDAKRWSQANFVGRRRVMSQVLEGLLRDGCVLVHGLPGMGKSRLLARVAARLDDRRTIVVEVGADGLTTALVEAVERSLVPTSALGDALAQLRAGRDGGEPGPALAELLELLGHEPTLLLVDDLDRALGPDERGTLDEACLASLIDVPQIELLLASRYVVSLVREAKLRTVQLVPMSATCLTRLATTLGLPTDLGIDLGVSERCVRASLGSPAIMAALVRLALRDLAKWDTTTAALEAWQRDGATPLPTELALVLARAESEALLRRLNGDERELLGELALVGHAIPLVFGVDASLDRLIDLGLVDHYDDHDDSTICISPLVRPLVIKPHAELSASVARKWLTPMLQAPSRRPWPLVFERQVVRLGLVARQPQAIVTSASVVLDALHGQGRYREGAELARECLALLEPSPYPIPALLRWKAAEHLLSIGELDEARRLTLDRGGPLTPSVELGLDRIAGQIAARRGDLDEATRRLEDAMSRATRAGHERGAALLAGELARVEESSGLHDLARSRHHRRLTALARGPDVHSPALAREELREQVELSATGRLHVLAALNRDLAMFERDGNELACAMALARIGRARNLGGEAAHARSFLTEALNIFERLGDAHAHAWVRSELARAASMLGELDAARASLDALAHEHEARQEPRELALILGQLGRLHEARGEFEDARRCFEGELESYAELGDRRSRILALGDLARVRALRGTLDDARDFHAQRLEGLRACHDLRAVALVKADIARHLADQGQLSKALGLHRDNLEAFILLEERRSVAITRADLGRVLVRQRRLGEALDELRGALEILEPLQDLHSVAAVLGDIAHVTASMGASVEARNIYRRALEHYERLGDPLGRAVTLANLAQLQKTLGQLELAQTGLRESFEILDTLGAAGPRAAVGLALAQLTASLPEPQTSQSAQAKETETGGRGK